LPDVIAVIPARWGSSRFPGKVLAPLAGRPLLLHACEAAARASRVGEVVVATDERRVAEVVRAAGYPVEMTAADHPSGTDRVAEVVRRRGGEIVIGLQADEPFLPAADLDALANALAARAPAPALATLAWPLESVDEFLDPNVVKVVADGGGRALYFSRAPIPFPRDGASHLAPAPRALPGCGARRHVGVYGWTRAALEAFTALPPSPLERSEGLEQLRALEAGWPIAVLPATAAPLGVDTPEDLNRAEQRLARTTGTDTR
jgi:3-deoxy-manno-octulosonate cytidylyltransferase (CMP-KDO synthetase)